MSNVIIDGVIVSDFPSLDAFDYPRSSASDPLLLVSFQQFLESNGDNELTWIPTKFTANDYDYFVVSDNIVGTIVGVKKSKYAVLNMQTQIAEITKIQLRLMNRMSPVSYRDNYNHKAGKIRQIMLHKVVYKILTFGSLIDQLNAMLSALNQYNVGEATSISEPNA